MFVGEGLLESHGGQARRNAGSILSTNTWQSLILRDT